MVVTDWQQNKCTSLDNIFLSSPPILRQRTLCVTRRSIPLPDLEQRLLEARFRKVESAAALRETKLELAESQTRVKPYARGTWRSCVCVYLHPTYFCLLFQLLFVLGTVGGAYWAAALSRRVRVVHLPTRSGTAIGGKWPIVTTIARGTTPSCHCNNPGAQNSMTV